MPYLTLFQQIRRHMESGYLSLELQGNIEKKNFLKIITKEEQNEYSP